ncbi:MAG TPA: hypothetical protein VIJ90_00830 [Gemmatimonadaceae bacterium]
MKITRSLPIVLGLLLISSRPATAQTLTILASPAAMIISSATAGLQPNAPPADVSTNYSVTTPANLKSGTISAQIFGTCLSMPTGTKLFITMTAPPGATNVNNADLSTGAITVVVTGIPQKTNATSLGITYNFSATAAAGVLSSTCQVRFTIY